MTDPEPSQEPLPADHYQYDLIVIGGGVAGLNTATEAASLGAKVAMFNHCHPSHLGNKYDLGGIAINAGAFPVKLMHQAAILGQHIHDSKHFGWRIDDEDVTHNWNVLIEAIRKQVERSVMEIKSDIQRYNIKCVQGNGSFVDPHTVRATTEQGEEVELTAAYIVIAIGSRPQYPSVYGAKEFGITNEDIFNMEHPPGKTLILGSGHNGMEYAGVLHLLGFDVTVMSRSDNVLKLFDKEMVEIVKQDMEEKGIHFLFNCTPHSIIKCTCQNTLKVAYTIKDSDMSVEAFDTIILTVGRRVPSGELNLDRAGIQLAEDGERIETDNERTNVPHIYAVGDVQARRPQVAGLAIKTGRLLARRLFGASTVCMDHQTFGFAIYTPIEYGIIGLTEEQSLNQYGEENIEVYHGYYTPFENYIPPRIRKYCFLKVIAEREGEQKVLGIHYTGPNAGEVIQSFVCAMRCGLTLSVLQSTVPSHVCNAEEIFKLSITKRSGAAPEPAACCS